MSFHGTAMGQGLLSSVVRTAATVAQQVQSPQQQQYQPLPQDVTQTFIAPTYSAPVTYAPVITSSMPTCVSCAEKGAATALCPPMAGLAGPEQWRATLVNFQGADPCVVRELPYCPGQECVAAPPYIPEVGPPETYGANGSDDKKAFMTFGILALVVLGGGYAIYRSTQER